MKLIVRAILAFVCGFALCAAMLFIPAGTVQYPGAWLFLALLFVPMLILGVVLYVKSPELLILDEPLHGLDTERREMVRAIIDDYCSQPDRTLIMVTHYPEELPTCITHHKRL